jgi:murein DD-endopeptidase MepM/ murein hydrolase activator NlpD
MQPHPVIPFDPQKDKIILLDLGETNQELNTDVLSGTASFTDYINNKLRSAKARYGIGGYREKRAVYGRSKLFGDGSTEPRRIHLGTDIWGKPHAPVMSPLDGIIHSFAFNNNFGDYGATIILTHHLDGKKIHTLYGHLSLNSIKNIQEGDRVSAGDVIAEFGIPAENGHWPPHLHFQVIRDLEGWKGDYPGVCSETEKEKYFANCPDPDYLLNLNRWLSL